MPRKMVCLTGDMWQFGSGSDLRIPRAVLTSPQAVLDRGLTGQKTPACLLRACNLDSNPDYVSLDKLSLGLHTLN